MEKINNDPDKIYCVRCKDFYHKSDFEIRILDKYSRKQKHKKCGVTTEVTRIFPRDKVKDWSKVTALLEFKPGEVVTDVLWTKADMDALEEAFKSKTRRKKGG